MRENLTFSAALRLPRSYSWAERKEKVNTVIDELGLRKVADSWVSKLLCYLAIVVCWCAIRLVLRF